MSLFNYVGTPNSNLICCICRAPFNDPITTSTCNHTFCRECIMRALSHSPQCPVDRLPLSEDDLEPANSIVRSMVDELMVECVYKEDGCTYQGERQHLAAHLKEKCLFSEGGRQMKEMNETAQESNDPSSQSTPSTSQPTVKAHAPRVTQLTEQNILLRHRVETLENVVQAIKKEMSAVKLVLGPWMRNATIGPSPVSRRRSESEVGPSTILPTISEDASPASSISVAPPSPPESTTGDEGPSSYVPPPLPNVANTEDLASYFPADDEVRVQRPVESQTHRRHSPPQTQRQRPGHASHHSVPGMNSAEQYSNYAPSYAYTGGYGAISPPYPGAAAYSTPGASTTSILVSDLDTSSSSLLHTLQGLHSNVITLSSNVDELNRKADLALNMIGGGGVTLMNGGVVGEVLRLGEEVMGVRANVQGLRMQVHGMLMGAVGVGGSPALSNTGFVRQPGQSTTPNLHSGVSEDDNSLAGRGQIPIPGGMGPMSPALGLNAGRFGPFPGPLGITKL